jgi:hypothetical protein
MNDHQNYNLKNLFKNLKIPNHFIDIDKLQMEIKLIMKPQICVYSKLTSMNFPTEFINDKVEVL